MADVRPVTEPGQSGSARRSVGRERRRGSSREGTARRGREGPATTGRGPAAACGACRTTRTGAGRRPATWRAASLPGACPGRARGGRPSSRSDGATSIFVPRSSGLIRRRGSYPSHAIPIPGTVNREPAATVARVSTGPSPIELVELPRSTPASNRPETTAQPVGQLRAQPYDLLSTSAIPVASDILVKSSPYPVDGETRFRHAGSGRAARQSRPVRSRMIDACRPRGQPRGGADV